MIDLMNNGINGKNGNSDYIPCPSCSELEAIKDMLKAVEIYEGEPPLVILSTLISELKMWRSKDEYDKKMKAVMVGAITKKLEDNGFQMDGEIS